MNLYELIFSYKPDLSKELIEDLNTKIKSFISDNKGEIDSFDDWGQKKLAYPIDNYFEANFYFCKFKVLPKFILELRELMRLNENFLRYNIMKIECDFSKRRKKVRKPKTQDSYENKTEKTEA